MRCPSPEQKTQAAGSASAGLHAIRRAMRTAVESSYPGCTMATGVSKDASDAKFKRIELSVHV